MENRQYPSWKHGLVYGLYVSLALIILTLLYYVLELNTERWTGYLSYAVLLGGIIISCLHYRNRHLNGCITYGQSFTTGFFTGLFASIVAAIFTVIFMSVVGEEYIQTLMDAAEENMLKSRPNMTDEELDMAMKWTRRMMNPVWLSILVFLGNLVFSVIFALIVSIFIKKEDNSIASEA